MKRFHFKGNTHNRITLGKWAWVKDSSVSAEPLHYSDYPMHPALDLSDLAEVYPSEELDIRIKRRFLEGHKAYHVMLLSALQVHAHEEGLGVSNLYCSRRHTDGIGRYDFVEVKATEEDVPEGAKVQTKFFGQVGAFIAVMRQQTCIKLYVLLLWLEELHVGNGPSNMHLFPECVRFFKYQKDRQDRVHRQLIPIEHLLRPAFIIPLDCKYDLLLKSRYHEMLRGTLIGIDMEFVARPSNLPMHHFLSEDQTRSTSTKRAVLPYLLPKHDLEQVKKLKKLLPEFITRSFCNEKGEDLQVEDFATNELILDEYRARKKRKNKPVEQEEESPDELLDDEIDSEDDI
jgi:hypothetical protein